jgi:type II secretory ATPase GspE/PulE/Tfp pilus assembly ATPase PilB-like protein
LPFPALRRFIPRTDGIIEESQKNVFAQRAVDTTELGQEWCRNTGLWIPLSWDKNGVEILVDDPKNLNKTDNIKTLMKTGKIHFSVAIREDIQEFIRLFFDPNKQMAGEATMDDVLEDFDMLPDVEFEEEEDEIVTDDADEASSQVVKLVDQAIIAAYRKNASDIHIEPSPITKATSIRFRLDGVCQEYTKVPNSMVRGIISRIKILSGIHQSSQFHGPRHYFQDQDHVQSGYCRKTSAPGRQDQIPAQRGSGF